MSVAAMQIVFNDLLDAFKSADSMRNFESGGLYRENNLASKQTVKMFASEFQVAATANDQVKMQSVFDELLDKFKSADHMRNYLVSRMFIEDEKIRKERISAFKKRFADAIVVA